MVQDCGATIAKYLLCVFNFVFFVSIYQLFYPIFSPEHFDFWDTGKMYRYRIGT